MCETTADRRINLAGRFIDAKEAVSGWFGYEQGSEGRNISKRIPNMKELSRKENPRGEPGCSKLRMCRSVKVVENG